MNILITGATGFVGKALLNYISQQHLFVSDQIWLLTSHSVEGYKYIFHKGYTFTQVDFLNIGCDSVDVVLHMGAATPKKANETGIDFAGKYAENAITTEHLLRNLPNVPRKIIFISSVSVYEPTPVINEDTPLNSSDLYGVSKIMCEQLLREYSEENHTVLEILRLGQIYGEGEEKYGKIISTFLKQILEGERISLYNDGNAVRSNLYVYDLAELLCKAICDVEQNLLVNVCSSQAVSVHNIAKMCCNALNVDFDKNVQLVSNDAIIRNIKYDNGLMQDIFKITETPIQTGINRLAKYLEGEYSREGN